MPSIRKIADNCAGGLAVSAGPRFLFVGALMTLAVSSGFQTATAQAPNQMTNPRQPPNNAPQASSGIDTVLRPALSGLATPAPAQASPTQGTSSVNNATPQNPNGPIPPQTPPSPPAAPTDQMGIVQQQPGFLGPSTGPGQTQVPDSSMLEPLPPGQLPPGQLPSGQLPPGQRPPEQRPSDQVPGSNRSQTGQRWSPGPQPFSTPPMAAVPTGPSVVETILSESVDPDVYAVLKTSLGEIKIKLFQNHAPQTVQNFVGLATGSRESVDVKTGRKSHRPFYDGLLFHRVVPGFLIQAGCPFGNGKGGPGFTILDEISPTLRHDKAGIVSMAPARTGATTLKNSNGSQFFITLAPRPELDGQFTIFGEVVEGMDVVKKIGKVKTGPTERPIRRVYIQTVEIIGNIPPPEEPSENEDAESAAPGAGDTGAAGE